MQKLNSCLYESLMKSYWQFLIVVYTSVCSCYEQVNCISLNKACKFKMFDLQSIFYVIVVKIFDLTLTEEVFRFACLWLNSSGFADRKHLCMESALSNFRSWIVRRIFRKAIKDKCLYMRTANDQENGWLVSWSWLSSYCSSRAYLDPRTLRVSSTEQRKINHCYLNILCLNESFRYCRFFFFFSFFWLTKPLKNKIILYLQETAYSVSVSVFGPISRQKRYRERWDCNPWSAIFSSVQLFYTPPFAYSKQ